MISMLQFAVGFVIYTKARLQWVSAKRTLRASEHLQSACHLSNQGNLGQEASFPRYTRSDSIFLPAWPWDVACPVPR